MIGPHRLDEWAAMDTRETTTSLHIRTDDGLLVARVKAGVLESLPLAQDNGRAAMELKGDDLILIDFSQAATRSS